MIERRRMRAVVTALSLLTVFLGSATTRAQGVTAAFDWSMPDRFGRVDARGMIDYFTTPEAISPSSWQVDFTACGSTGSADSYRWSVDGEFVAEVAACDAFSHEFPEEGIYEVSLTVEGSDGSSATTTERVTVQDWLIVAVGDSYGSGEGVPDIPIHRESWDNFLAASRNVQSALQELGRVEADYNSTVSDANLVRRRFDEYVAAASRRNSLCNPLNHPRVLIPGTQDFRNCVDAQSAVNTARRNLVAALARLGRSGLIDTIARIREILDDIVATARALLNTARAAVEDAREALENRREGLRAEWQDRKCHRSAFSGQAQAAILLEELDPRTSVTFVHLACSGATITNGLLGEYAGVDPDGQMLAPQIDEARRLVGEREIDAFLISIGGNDVHFADILKACLVQTDCSAPQTGIDQTIQVAANLLCGSRAAFSQPCFDWFGDLQGPESGREIFLSHIGELPGLYAALRERIESVHPDLLAERVFITEYPNAVRDDAGEYCHFGPGTLTSAFPGMTRAESEWAETVVTRQLNATIGGLEESHGWNVVQGIASDFERHGYCAADHWFVRLGETFDDQGDINGIVHPSFDGYQAYADRIVDSFRNKLYVDGEPVPPGGSTTERFRRGDGNVDGNVDLSDGIYVLNFLFLGTVAPTCFDAMDTNDTGVIDLSDGIAVFGFLFLGGPPPAAPGNLACGIDVGADDLDCAAYPACE